MLTWVILLIPSWYWWHASLFWVIAVSIYANFVSHWGAWQAVRAELVAGRAEQAAKDAVEIVRMGVQEDTEMLHRIEKTVTHEEP
jgi:hypothetical protein